jgi:hypothetical protein
MRSSPKQGHWGIIGMRERARSLGCKLDFLSTPLVGTEVAIRVPARKAYAAKGHGKGWAQYLFSWFARQEKRSRVAEKSVPNSASSGLHTDNV